LQELQFRNPENIGAATKEKKIALFDVSMLALSPPTTSPTGGWQKRVALPHILASYPPSSNLFKWLHDLVRAWDENDSGYTFWFQSSGLPHRNYTIRASHRGQNRVLQLVRDAIRYHRNEQAVDLKQMEIGLADAVRLMKVRSHFSRFHINEAPPFMGFFIVLLETAGIYGLELKSAEEQALAFLSCVREDEECRKGNLLLVEDLRLLGILDRLVDGGVIEEHEAPTTEIGIHTSG
jgi:hypothetical protein